MALATSAISASALAAPSRTLPEPAIIARSALTAEVPPAVLNDARCTRAALKSSGLGGLRCRLLALPFATPSTELELSLADIERALWRYAPISPRSELPKERFLAHRQACLSLSRMRSGLACACGLRNLELAPRQMPAEELGPLRIELQTHLAVLGCSALASPDRGGPKSVFSPRDAALARELAQERLTAVVESRRFELKRCVDRHAPFGFVRAHEREPLAACACRVTKRWRFPRGNPARVLRVAITGDKKRDVLVGLEIAENGQVTSCGDLEVRP